MRILVLLFIAFLNGCVSTDEWTKTDTRYEITYQIVNAADAYTTTQIRYHPTVVEKAWPTRQLIGASPSEIDVVVLFATYGISHYFIARALPTKWRRYYQVGTIGYSTALIINNCQLGLCK